MLKDTYEGIREKMAVYLWEISDMICRAGYSLVAGKDSLNKNVTGITYAESSDMIEYIGSDELVAASGIGFLNESDLCEFILMITQKNASGLLITEGKYIKYFSKTVLNCCNECRLPLYKIRWERQNPKKIHELEYVIGHMNSRKEELEQALINAVLSPDIYEKYVPIFNNSQYYDNDTYCIGIIEDFEYKHEIHEKIWKKNKIFKVQEYLKRNCESCFAVENAGLFICFFVGYDNQTVREHIVEMYFQIRTDNINEHIYIGIGNNVGELKKLYQSYRQAKYVAMIKKKNLLVKPIVRFSQLGIYTIFGAVEQKDILRDYYRSYLGPLQKYDKSHHTDYFIILESLINHDFHVSEVAARLYMHRSSVNYKIGKIQEILDCNLSLMKDRIQLTEAYRIWKILYGKEEIPDRSKKDVILKIPEKKTNGHNKKH